MRSLVSRGLSLFLVTTFLVAFSGPVVLGQDEDPQPRIAIEQMRHDFGEVFEQKAYKATFTVKNTGKADLRIKKVKPG